MFTLNSRISLIENSLSKLIRYIEASDYKGYDPYDILNSKLKFSIFGRWGPIIATQLHKRNPINIRKLMMIQKSYNPKGMGLLLHAYSLLYRIKPQPPIKEKMDFFPLSSMIFRQISVILRSWATVHSKSMAQQ